MQDRSDLRDALNRTLDHRAAIVGPDGQMRYCTPSWRQAYGPSDHCPDTEDAGLIELVRVQAGDDAADLTQSALDELAAGDSDNQECEFESAPEDPSHSGVLRQPRWFRLRLSRMDDSSGPDALFAAQITDITRHKAVQSALRGRERRLQLTNVLLRELSERDPLTSLWNRRGLERALQREQRQGQRTGKVLSAILIDCDDFKRINESIGHTGGDWLLRRISKLLHGHLRPRDVAARIGGDEFLVLLPGTELEDAHVIAERLRQRIADDAVVSGRNKKLEEPITVSLGIAAVPSDATSVDEVLRLTQGALKQAKVGGKNRVISHEQQAG